MNTYLIGMLISMVAYIVIGLVISKKVKTSNDYYVAGRKAPTFLIVGSLVASYCSTGIFMGTAGETYDGFFGPYIITPILIVGYLLGSIFFGKYLRRSEALTISEFFEKRFNSKKLRVLSAIIALIVYIVYMLSIMQGIGALMSYVTGLDYNLCILLALITFTILTCTSGSKGVLITDTIMFGIFTIATIVSSILIINKAGGLYGAIESITQVRPDMLSWHGNLNHLYDNGIENIIWAITTGVTWISVAMVAPWQASRYLMAKNEHTVIRSSVFATLGVFLMEFLVSITAVIVFNINPSIEDPTYSMIWASTNVLPTILGTIMLTGVLAAGISSATTFMSLIGSSVANDILSIQDDKKKVRVGKLSVIIGSIIIFLLAYFNPPNIYVILCLGATVVACSWLPICIASVWSKRITKTGAFCGMLSGFLVCSIMKIVLAITNTSLPAYLDPFFFGIIANILGMIIGSKVTRVSPKEKEEYEKLKTTPKSELDPKEIKITKRIVMSYFGIGIIITLMLIFMWVLPYTKSL